ncbi:hypothetical protein N9X75_00300 [Alphaproteobacteria bacterium]|nr:hypothetical protein [Alphaproteobacteria bacterium]MDB3974208.1 hypothetical protein [Alphaproteobacteria bacterium]
MKHSQSTCEQIQQSELASDIKKDFICANDQLHESFVNSPMVVIVYVFAVLLVAFLVFRSSNYDHKDPEGPKDDSK